MNTAPSHGSVPQASDTSVSWRRFGAHGMLIAVPASLVLWAIIVGLIF